MSAGLSPEGKLAEKSVMKALEEDARKAGLASGEENLKASALASMGHRTTSSVVHALKGAIQLNLSVESLCQVGDALLDVGCHSGAREEHQQRYQGPGSRQHGTQGRERCLPQTVLLLVGSDELTITPSARFGPIVARGLR